MKTAILAAAVCIAGCTASPQPQIDSTLSTLKAERDRARAHYESLAQSENPKDRETAEKTLEHLAKLDAGITKAEHLAQQVFDEQGNINPQGAAAAAGALLPPPFNLIVMIGGPLALLATQEIRARRRKQEADELEKAARSIVNGIDRVRNASPAFAEAMKEHKGELIGAYTEKAIEIVNDERL